MCLEKNFLTSPVQCASCIFRAFSQGFAVGIVTIERLYSQDAIDGEGLVPYEQVRRRLVNDSRRGFLDGTARSRKVVRSEWYCINGG